MTKVLKMLGSMGLVAVMGVALFGAAVASAESPPNPPARFAGTVLVDGAQPPSGTTIEARIGSTSCGVTTTFAQGGNQNYVLDVPALDPGATPNCGTEDAVVTFFVGGVQANETGLWRNYQLNILNLTVTTPDDDGDDDATATPTVKGPDTGSAGLGGTEDGSAAPLLFTILGLGAIAFGVGGAAVARRSR